MGEKTDISSQEQEEDEGACGGSDKSVTDDVGRMSMMVSWERKRKLRNWSIEVTYPRKDSGSA